GGARGFLVMNSIGVDGFGGSDLSGAKNLIKSLNFSFDPSLPTVFGAALRDQAGTGPLDYNILAGVIASKLPNPVLGPLTAAVFQSPKPDTDSASQISDIVALVRGFFNDLDNGDEKVTNDASAIVEIGKLARFESGVYPPAYGPFALTSYEYEWWLQEKDGKVKDKDLFYNKRYPLYLKQKGSGPNGRPNYESILEDR
ncbi:MAG: hypothetical protein JWO82_3879, partial [Akkermansiaceae bacterium]|nr:hypothetical protein [Akkermansiaceae bacterium]